MPEFGQAGIAGDHSVRRIASRRKRCCRHSGNAVAAVDLFVCFIAEISGHVCQENFVQAHYLALRVWLLPDY